MELCGIPDLDVILRIPESKSIYEAVPCPDRLFLDFLVRCLEFDPEKRMSTTEASQHPWILEGNSSDSQSMVADSQHSLPQFGGPRQRDADGARENVFEESPERPQSFSDGQKIKSLQMVPQFSSQWQISKQ
eukprot:CAMPEP_0176396880 /NCGR_PEP_ID=MMETSP0126-20121128/44641_1 /TAXON_ID=141414 ORGANISM="Strombidinopsis acuminatum, Strain SPMC142" /NCGR_SAMPLE_ID=MMETSP0126 /ASSEMBLY_ACC=CAM_ASM_000229 /LENGTH=131 /DNA_ID=CAMNT_0017770781 /DNA_START=857 /DNA_END=1252 /DNA_ORIENTATION=-